MQGRAGQARVRVSVWQRIVTIAGRTSDGEERLLDSRGGWRGRGRSSWGRPRGSVWHVRGVPLQDSGDAQGATCWPNHVGERCRVRLVFGSGQFDTVRQELLETQLTTFVVVVVTVYTD